MRKIALTLLASVLLVVPNVPNADAKTKKAAKVVKAPKAEKTASVQKKPKPIETGDPLPKKMVTNPACADQGALRILGDDPVTPFAYVKKGKLTEAGIECCAQWARAGSHWKSVDAYGAVVGEMEVTGGEGYDVSQCYELELTKTQGQKGVGLYLQGDYTPPKSVIWAPKATERAALAESIVQLEKQMVPKSEYTECEAARPFAERVLYFDKGNSNDSVREKWAVVGGPLLVVARLQGDGKWITRYVDTFGSSSCALRTYQPRAVFDADADGVPEIFLHYDYGDGFGDAMLGYVFTGFEGKWETAAISVGGSTA